MKNKFPGYYKPSETEFNRLWKEAIIILDTNVLLDFYRYSKDTTNAMFEVFDQLQNRIWIPYKVSHEYHLNLNDVISTQIKSYEYTLAKLIEFKEQIYSERGHPFLENLFYKEIDCFCDKFEKILINRKEEIELLILDNPIKERIASLLNEKIGDLVPAEQLKECYKIGQERYRENIPPGYKDKNSKKNQPEYNLYGDFIIWKSVLEKASKDKVDVIMVTGDTKEDWFQRHKGKTIGPRPELIQEFCCNTNQLIYIYTTNQFLKYANGFIGTKINDKAIEEVSKIIEKGNEDSLSNENSDEIGNISNDSNSNSTYETNLNVQPDSLKDSKNKDEI